MELVAWIRLQATGCIEEISHFTTSEFKDPQGCTSAAAVGDLAMKMTLTAGQKDALQTQTLKIPYCGSGPSTQHGSLAEHRLTIWSKLFQTWHRHILHSARPSELPAVKIPHPDSFIAKRCKRSVSESFTACTCGSRSH